MPDAVDRVLDQWAQERPDVDVSPMAVIGRISRSAAILDRHIAATLNQHDLLPGEFDLLAALRRAGAPHRMTVGDVLASTMVSSGAITNRLNRLVDKGFVTRETDPANRRSVIVTLSRQGLSVVNDALVSHVENERDLLASLDRDEQQHLSDLLRKLLLALGDDASAAGERL
ncbi:MarR family winged helix-turn-helix transcriptional regulator [Clavibacter michiganensis]|uniref:MarR family transcriptional regulator n=1 Tax=Clavibacter michiganensis subsp. insidiosus TaxID=33014 RepID=A0A0D5CGG6_9MICO|nr:MarR family transcriptional regulator [Clavibacter michiganensis]AJW78706.1 MarR family transcriptional regulator [Clavibacter michiganensis subsp. insidiosus]AWF98632.1 MarR family transcriptional regulator [Clavibacter michiganensis subsp. insidiosus]AWG01152.1 MarR family transcriptional regulator [Clavibacter michiganensis subsp. insidiosus]OQJ60287.1 MarR family transcriptional regulator [Clavibacter michiganensis subsp. insidiosus]RII88777.1 MarR family transcriptional regulator [Clav